MRTVVSAILDRVQKLQWKFRHSEEKDKELDPLDFYAIPPRLRYNRNDARGDMLATKHTVMIRGGSIDIGPLSVRNSRLDETCTVADSDPRPP